MKLNDEIKLGHLEKKNNQEEREEYTPRLRNSFKRTYDIKYCRTSEIQQGPLPLPSKN